MFHNYDLDIHQYLCISCMPVSMYYSLSLQAKDLKEVMSWKHYCNPLDNSELSVSAYIVFP